MKLSDKFNYYLLCEDAQIKTFLESFLKNQSISTRKIYTIPIPAGNGCGEAFVREKFPDEVAVLQAKNYQRIALIVCTDADKFECKEREKILIDSVVKKHKNWSKECSCVMIWIPKREIETWIHFFRGEQVDESMEFRHSGNPLSCRDESYKMYKYCQGRYTERQDELDSLKWAKEEFERVCKIQNEL